MKRVSKISLVIFVCLIFCLTTAAGQSEWMRIQSDNGELSLEIPSNYISFRDAEGFAYYDMFGTPYRYRDVHLIHATTGELFVHVYVFRISSSKYQLDRLVDKVRPGDSRKIESVKGYTIREFSKTLRNVPPYTCITRFIASSDFLYMISAAKRGSSDLNVERVFSSINLLTSGKNDKQSAATPVGKPFSTLKAKVLDSLLDNTSVKDSVSPSSPTEKAPSYTPFDDDAPLTILSKPFPWYTDMARQAGVTGVVRLRLQFNQLGYISKAQVVSYLPYGLDKSSIFAAAMINFLPAMKNGSTVSVAKIVEYSFSIY